MQLTDFNFARCSLLAARCTVKRLMCNVGLQVEIPGKPLKTAVFDRAAPCLLNQVNRQFHALALYMLWVSELASPSSMRRQAQVTTA